MKLDAKTEWKFFLWIIKFYTCRHDWQREKSLSFRAIQYRCPLCNHVKWEFL